jgi:hypothetical protein
MLIVLTYAWSIQCIHCSNFPALAVTMIPVRATSIILPWKVQGTCAHEYTRIVFACIHDTTQSVCVTVASLSLDPPSEASRELLDYIRHIMHSSFFQTSGLDKFVGS